MQGLIINADDYALNSAVDAAVLRLAERGVVTSTSAMVLSPAWPRASRDLDPGQLDIGLHLDFTSPFAERAGWGCSLKQLIARAYTGRLDRAALRGAIGQQLDAFDRHIGQAPRFVDGHQHVHQLPQLRDALCTALQQHYGERSSGIALRSCVPRRWRGLKAWMIASLGARRLAELARGHGWAMNSDFFGVYAFSAQADLPRLWAAWMAGLQGSSPLAMCHIACEPRAPFEEDTIHAMRLKEYAWLSSDRFKSLCAQFGLMPARWPQP